MRTKKFSKENITRTVSLYTALLFCVFSLVFFSILREKGKAFMSLISILYVFIPDVAERLFKFRIQPALYVFVLFYTVCPLLGYSYNLYYYLAWWDDILHAFAGVIFAMFGAYLPKVLNKNGEASVALCAFSAFFFSVAISGLWELCEFSMDTFFGTDMQKDTLLYSMRPSYLLSELLGFPKGELAPITDASMLINGQRFEGYVDLGIIDTMNDVFVETLGAVVYLIIYRAGNGKYFVFEKLPDEEVKPSEVREGVPALPVGVALELATSESEPSENAATEENFDEPTK